MNATPKSKSAVSSPALKENKARRKLFGKYSMAGKIKSCAVYAAVLGTACFIAGAVAAEKPANNGLVGYWSFDGSATDLSGNSNNGAIQGSANYVNGRVGKAFQFDGKTSIDCGNNASLSIAKAITIELWFYAAQYPEGYAVHSISKWSPLGTKDANYVMYFFGKDSGGMARKTSFLATANGKWDNVSGPYTFRPDLNTWYHIAWTYGPKSGGIIYVNGMKVDSFPYAGTLAENTANLRMTMPPGGILDEVKIYDRELSPSELAANANQPIPPWLQDYEAALQAKHAKSEPLFDRHQHRDPPGAARAEPSCCRGHISLPNRA